MDKKFIYDPALNDEYVVEVLKKRFPEFDIEWSSGGNPKIKRNVFHQVVVRIKPHKDKNKNIDYIRVISSQYYSIGLAYLMGYFPFFIIRGVTKGSFYDDVENILTEEFNTRFQSIE